MTIIVFHIVCDDTILSLGSDFNLPRAYQSAARLQRAHSFTLRPRIVTACFCLPGGKWISSGEFAQLINPFVANLVPACAKPKTLKERLAWMSANLPGFCEELDAVTEARNRAISNARGRP